VTGPFETERQAREATRQYPAGGAANGNPNLSILLDAVIAAGVPLGAYDRRILEWLAGWEPATCAVIAGLVTRAHMG
jgi:hypothetical protein